MTDTDKDAMFGKDLRVYDTKMTKNYSAPDIIEIGGVKYKKVVEERKEPQTLKGALLRGTQMSRGNCELVCRIVEKWLPEEIELDVNNDEFSLLDRGYNSYRDRAIENLR